MKKKNVLSIVIVAVAILVLVLIGRFLWLRNNIYLMYDSAPSYTQEDIVNLLAEIKSVTGAPFSETGASKIIWNLGATNVDREVEATGFQAIKKGEADTADLYEYGRKVGEFLLTKGFRENDNNTSYGTFVGAKGYYKDNKDDIVCRVAEQRSAVKMDEVKTQVYCGIMRWEPLK